jgi:hypothetical protein
VTGFGLTRLPRRRQRPVMAPLPGSTTAVPVGFALTRTAGPMPEILLAGGIDFVLTSTVAKSTVLSWSRLYGMLLRRLPQPLGLLHQHFPVLLQRLFELHLLKRLHSRGCLSLVARRALSPRRRLPGLLLGTELLERLRQRHLSGSDAVARAVLGRATSCRQSRTRDARSGFLQLGPRGVEFIDRRDHPYGLPLIGCDTGALSGSPSGDGSWT